MGISRYVKAALFLVLATSLFYVFLVQRPESLILQPQEPNSLNDGIRWADTRPEPYDGPHLAPQKCEAHYGITYLQEFAKNHIDYCAPDSKSRVTCFSNRLKLSNGARTDSFCIVSDVLLDTNLQKPRFEIECELRDLTQEEVSSGIPAFNSLPSYWYNTGPANIFKKHFTWLKKSDQSRFARSISTATTFRSWTMMTQREDVRFNIWHGLMEIMSAWFSLDIINLATTLDASIPSPDIPEDSVATKKSMIFLDDLADGPLIEAWSVWPAGSISHPSKLRSEYPDQLVHYKHIIVPLAGGSNPLWQGDWDILNCANSTLLRGFVDRAFTLLNIADSSTANSILGEIQSLDRRPSVQPTQPIRVVFINRTQKRRLTNQASLLSTFRSTYPDIALDSVDFTTYPFRDQLALDRHATTILVGVHGAGLTHGMFLAPGSALVEFQPKGISTHVGFRNMCDMVGVGYHRGVTAEPVPDDAGNAYETKKIGDWQEDDVYIDPAEWMRVLGEAVASVAKSTAHT